MRAAVVGHVEWIEFASVPEMPAAGDIVHAREVWAGAGGRRRRGRGPAREARRRRHVLHGARRRRARAPLQARARGPRADGRRHVPAGAAAARRSSTWTTAGERTITVIGDRLGPARRRPAAMGRAGARRTRVPHGRGPAARCGSHGRRACSCPRLAGSRRSPGRAWSSTRWWRAGRPRRALRDGPARPAAARGGAHRGRRGRRVGDGERERHLGRRAARPGRSRTPTGAATASRPGSPTGSAPAWRSRRRSSSAARCGAACLTGRGPYSGQLRGAQPSWWHTRGDALPSSGSIGRPLLHPGHQATGKVVGVSPDARKACAATPERAPVRQ